MYLTLAPFGGPVEGVRAASLNYFGKPAKALTAAEAALLVALPQSPSRRRLKRIEQAIEKQILTPRDRAGGITIVFHLEGLLRADSRPEEHTPELQSLMRISDA